MYPSSKVDLSPLNEKRFSLTIRSGAGCAHRPELWVVLEIVLVQLGQDVFAVGEFPESDQI